MRQLLAVSAALAIVLLSTACDLEPRVTTDAARELWSQNEPRVRQQVALLRDRQRALAGRMGELGGTAEPALLAAITALQDQLAAVEPAVAAAESAFSQASADIGSALSKANKVEARRIVESGLAAIDSSVRAATSALDAPEPQVVAVEGKLSSELAALALDKQRVRVIAHQGGQVELTNIEYSPDGSQVIASSATSRAAMDRALALASACSELRFSIVGHAMATTPPAQRKALSKARAEAVRGFLISAGVAASQIDKVEAAGGSDPGVDERIELVVTTPCAAKADQPPTTQVMAPAIPPPSAAPAAAAPPPPVRIEAVPVGH